MSKRIDGFLSRKAQTVWPAALVICYETLEDRQDGGRDGLPQIGAIIVQRWELERPATEDRQALEPVGLGDSFHAAKQSLEALIRSTKARA